MKIESNYSLKEFNTFGLDVKAKWFVEYDSVDELKTVLQRDELRNQAMLHIGRGSNLLFNGDFDGVVLHSNLKTIEVMSTHFGVVKLKVGSGVIWDDLCAFAATHNWSGVENLSAIPGEVGAAAVQNIGAYGVEFANVVDSVEVLRISDSTLQTFKVDQCLYGYRDSVFKGAERGHYIVLSVVVKLHVTPVFNLTYASLAAALPFDNNLTVQQVRDQVIKIRESKLPDPKVLGNAGSFFKNPVITTDFYSKLLNKFGNIPSYSMPDHLVKIPAAWLIEACNWKGKQIDGAGVYDKQSLVLVNYGGATAQSVCGLAQSIVNSVYERFGIMLVPEVNVVGNDLV